VSVPRVVLRPAYRRARLRVPAGELRAIEWALALFEAADQGRLSEVVVPGRLGWQELGEVRVLARVLLDEEGQILLIDLFDLRESGP
jgi:hypothetical protein